MLTYLLHKDVWILSHVNQNTYPCSLAIFFLVQFFGPSVVVGKWRDNKVIIRSLQQVLIAPFGRVRFLDSIVADVLTSTVKPMVDVWHVFRYYLFALLLALGAMKKESRNSSFVNNADMVIICLISAFPLWLRFMQCIKGYYSTGEPFPYLANALKYALSHTVVIAGATHPTFSNDALHTDWTVGRAIWLASTITTTIFTFSWDVKMDWGLGDVNYGFLRKRLLFRHRGFYYWVMFSNLILRFSWTLTLTPFAIFTNKQLYQTMVVPLIAFLELFRRFQWALLRVEWEHMKHSAAGFPSAPVFFDNERERHERAKNLGDEPSLLLESLLMVIGLLAVGTLAALF